MAASRKEIWVRIYGVPLQLWHEPVFRTILKAYGEVIGLDEETRGRSRFDVARVKILVPILGDIDFTQEISSQGLKFVIRVVEERGGPLEFVHISRAEEQPRWSEAGSSCDSGDRGDRGTEEALVEGGVFGGSVSGDSDGSEQGQHVVSVGMQTTQKGLEDNMNMKEKPQVSFGRAEVERPILSNLHADKTNGRENFCVDVTKVKSIRGLSGPNLGERGKLGLGEQEEGFELVGQASEVSPVFVMETNVNGPNVLSPIIQPVCFSEQGREDQIEEVERVIQVEGNSVIDKVDLLLEAARGKKNMANLGHNFTLEDSNLSSSSNSIPNSLKQSRQRKPLSRLPFPGMVGPKCLRLVEIVNSVGATSRRKKNSKEDRGSDTQKSGDRSEGEETESVPEVAEVETLSNPDGNSIDCVLNTAPVGNMSSSGINLLLGDETLEEVEVFVANRQGPEAKRQEAELILEIQADMGLNFVEEKEGLVEHLVELEERYREKLARTEERQGYQ
jgi:hypothetical protein